MFKILKRFKSPRIEPEWSKKMSGHIKVWRNDTGALLIDKPNTIVYQGSDIMAFALAGEANSAVSHMYVTYENNPSVTPTSVTVSDTRATFAALSAPYGYIRVPLSLVPSYFNDANYANNYAIFTSVVTTATAEGGAAFTAGTSNIYQVGLVVQRDPADSTKDLLFSETNFNQIGFSANYNLTIQWAIRITSA